MKIKDKKWLAAALIGILFLGAVAIVGQSPQLQASIFGGDQDSGSSALTKTSQNDVSTASITKKANAAQQCNPSGDMDKCVYNEYSSDGVTAQAYLSYDEVPNQVPETFQMTASCPAAVKMMYAEGSPPKNPEYTRDGVQFNDEYQVLYDYNELIQREEVVEIDIGNRAPLENGFTLICSDTVLNENGGASTWVAHTFPPVSLQEPDSDGDGVPDDEDEFPIDPRCSEDSDGDGVCDNKDAFPNDSTKQYDQDNDGVADSIDQCPRESGSQEFNGCPDSDNDGVPDNQDRCPQQGDQGFGIDSNGCPIQDNDGDGVGDNVDKCPATEPGINVDSKGCAADSDNDGVPDDEDQCPNTGNPPMGVNDQGCAVQDDDQDGVTNSGDECPQIYGSKLNGCPTFIDQILNTLGLQDLFG